MSTVTMRRVVTEALRLAEASPSTIYQQPDPETAACYYVWDGQPSCIFGQALVAAGVDVTTLSELEQRLREDEGDTSIDEVLRQLDIWALDKSPVTQRVCVVQDMQDQGHPWADLAPVLRNTLRTLDHY